MNVNDPGLSLKAIYQETADCIMPISCVHRWSDSEVALVGKGTEATLPGQCEADKIEDTRYNTEVNF